MALPSRGFLHRIAGRRPRLGPRVSHINLNVARIAMAIFVLLVWQILSALVGGGFVASPYDTLIAALKLMRDPAFGEAILSSIFCLTLGYGLASLIGIPAGLIMGGIPILGALLEPYVDALSSMPRIAFLPLIVVFLGLGLEAKVFMIFLGAVMPILINTYAGVLNTDRDLIEMARSAGASDRQIFTKIMLPGALPYVMIGLRVGASLALINTVVAELYTSVQGLGGLLSIYGNSFRMAPYFVVVIVLALIGVLMVHGLRRIETRLAPWRRQANP